jgi:hypothetical protein
MQDLHFMGHEPQHKIAKCGCKNLQKKIAAIPDFKNNFFHYLFSKLTILVEISIFSMV